MNRRTHGWCASCSEDSAVNAGGGECLWCGGPTVRRSGKRRGKPVGVYGKLTDAQLKALHRFHRDHGVSIRELGRRVWEAAGYASEKSAANAISDGFKRLRLPAMPRELAVRKANESRRSPESPGTKDRAAYKRWRRKRDGGYRPCQGAKLTPPEVGRPCERYALTASDFCRFHSPDLRAAVVAKAAEMRSRIGQAITNDDQEGRDDAR